MAVVSIIMVTLLFLDFTGTIHAWLGWMAKIQFLPALLALNVGVIAALVLITLVFGRIYCSVICPLGIMQDIFGAIGKKARKNRYSYSPALNILRYVMLGVMVLAIIFGIGSVVAILAPYSAYGRIAQNLLVPLWAWGNNILAYFAERSGSYAFYSVDVRIGSLSVLIVAAVTLVVLAVLSWRNGRTYCNTICPVGTVLGFFARFSWLKPVINTSKCNSCGLCARNCKAACIDNKSHSIDYSRCVACMDCLAKCHKGAISYAHPAVRSEAGEGENLNTMRRTFIFGATVAGVSATIKAAAKKVDGGLAVIEDKQVPERKSHIVPPGAKGHRNMSRHCTGCQLCVAVCPNGVLRPSTDPERFMQPESSYESGYCRPECTKCSEVCPSGAICKVTPADKSAIQTGHAVWVKANCIPLTDGVECGNCARHCPTGAIIMTNSDRANEKSVKIPVVNTEKCIGCGACENLCPARPFSAIYVEGHELHRSI